MSLGKRLTLYSIINVITVLLVVVLGRERSASFQDLVRKHLKLETEMQVVRKLHEVLLEQFSIADDALMSAGDADMRRIATLTDEAQTQVAILNALGPSAETVRGLANWKKENAEYDELFRVLSAKRPLTGAEPVRLSLQALRKEAEDHFRELRSIDLTLQRLLEASDDRLQRVLTWHWWWIAGLCLVPMAVCLALMGTFARRLSAEVRSLEMAHQRLAQGDFGVRLVSTPPAHDTHDEICILQESFDHTAAKLQRLDELKSRFYSMAAHDLRSPLNTMLLAVGCLKDPGRSEAQKFTYLGVIERKIGVLVNLVDSLLDSFFLRSDQVQVLRQQADVNEILTQCVSDFQMQATERDQQLVVEPFPGGGTLWCDAGKVSQVLENLLGNAIKYTRKSDIITITASETQDRAVQFSVRDNGPGIPKEEQEKIFEPFHRMESTSRAVAGYGLGLAICKQFVRAHGGNLWVESTPGAGATFCFVIPRSGGPPPA